MNEIEAYDQMEQEIVALANQFSITRMKVSTLNFDREYRRGVDGDFQLVQTKAIVRALGKITKVPIGADEEFKTFEEAEEAVKKKWSEYYREIRANRSEAQKKAEARRQKKYRERRRQNEIDLKRQQ